MPTLSYHSNDYFVSIDQIISNMLIQFRYFCSSLQQLPPAPHTTWVIPTPRAAPSPPATLPPTRATQPSPTVPWILNVERSNFLSGVLFELKFMTIKVYPLVGYVMYGLPRMKILVTSEAIRKWFWRVTQPRIKIINESPHETNISLLAISRTPFDSLHLMLYALNRHDSDENNHQ